MIFLYTLLLLLLAAARFLIARRAGWLERKYSRLSCRVHLLASAPMWKPGNANKNDAAAAAKRTYELGLATGKRDKAEVKYFAWRARADKLGAALNALRDWKGKKLPYTLGALDIWLVLYLIDYFGVAEFMSARNLLDSLIALFN
ncbi:MAG: hypothetical protein L0Y72_10615 [Gemmataceae bacterium]|nr:hypothetical protein [Gemmataceae bacterium]MCI0739486.1 hypothetical protein [Gemmataceae bacterium]